MAPAKSPLRFKQEARAKAAFTWFSSKSNTLEKSSIARSIYPNFSLAHP